MGSPCLIPLEDWKIFVFLPLTKSAMDEEAMYYMIKVVNVGGELKKWRIYFMKAQSSQPNAFSKSIFNYIFEVLPLIFS